MVVQTRKKKVVVVEKAAVKRKKTFIPVSEEKSIITKYTDPKFPSALGGVHTFAKQIKKPVSRVKAALSGLPAYVRHVPVRRRYPRGRVFVSGPFSQYHTDLIDMSDYSDDNQGYKFIFVLIDAFSKRCWLVPMMNKLSATAADAFESVVKNHLPFTPHSVYSDQGGEYKKEFRKRLEALGVKSYMSKDKDIKSSIAERVIRTIKGKLFKYLTLENTKEYISVLDLICDNYNNSFNSAIGMTPNEVGFHNAKLVFDRLYMGAPGGRYKKLRFDKHHKKAQFKFNVGDYVRITKTRRTFQKSYLPGVSIEVFKISKRIPRIPVVYRLVDMNDDDIIGTFYEQELVRTKKPKPTELHIIDKVLKTRTRNGVKEVFVSYLGWPKSFNDWIPADRIVDQDEHKKKDNKKRRRKWKRSY